MSDAFSKNKDPSQTVITFGKHQGLTVETLLANHRDYVEWLLGKSWLAERFSNLHAALLSAGTPTDETPEHNKIQARFLEPLFCEALIYVVAPAIKDRWRKKVEEYWSQLDGGPIQRFPKPKENARPCLLTKSSFEQKGIDVITDWHWDVSKLFDEEHECGNYLAGGRVGVEIKPSIGDEYPTVLRQMERLGVKICLSENYTGRGVSEPVVKQIFESNGYSLIFVREIEAEMLDMRTQI